MTLQQLKYVVEIANQDSISEAAKRLYISQPSLSNAVKDLEKELGISIFIRSNKGIELSEEGRVFLQSARRIVGELELMKNRYAEQPTQKYFSVSAQHYTFVLRAFADTLSEVIKSENQYNYEIHETTFNQVIEEVASGKSEVGVIYQNVYEEANTERLIRSKNLEFHELFKSAGFVMMSRKHPLAKKKELTVRDLKSYPYVSFVSGEYNSNYFCDELSQIYEHPQNIKVIDRSEMFYLMEKLNGFTICTGIVDRELNGKNIITVPLNVKEHITVGVIYLKSTILSPLAVRFLKKIEAETEAERRKDEGLGQAGPEKTE